VLKVNTREVAEHLRTSPNGRFQLARRKISEALGRKPRSTDLLERQPFDVEIQRIPPGATPFPYHSHSAQFEFYHVLAGTGRVRDESGVTAIGPGDAFLFKPGEAHQVSNDGTEDLMLFVVADNPLGESWHYPDSGKWGVQSPSHAYVRSAPLDYYDGEE